ncbi:hypothetical protein, partial [Nocardia aurea]
VAGAIASTDRERALRFANHAAEVANEITSVQQMTRVLVAVVEVIAPIEPDRAETIANKITDPRQRASALVWIAKIITPTNPGRAKSLLAVAWAGSNWEIPLSALHVIDSSVLKYLVADPMDDW